MSSFDSGAYDSGAFDAGAGAGGTNTNVLPGAASLTITGFAPNVTQTASQSVAPASASLTIAGYAPTVVRSDNQAVTPSAAAITITGYAPTVEQAAGSLISPTPASLTIAGYAPVIAQTASQSITLSPASLAITGHAPTVTQVDPLAPPATGGHGFEMVSMEPTWRRALRLRAEAKQKVELGRKQRKRAEFIEKLAAKEALSTKPDAQIETRIDSLLAEWVDLAPRLDLTPVAQVPPADAYQAFMARVAEHIRRIEDEDDEHAAEMLLLM